MDYLILFPTVINYVRPGGAPLGEREERMSKKYNYYLTVKENGDIVRRTMFWAASDEEAKQKVLEVTLGRVANAMERCPLWTEFPCTLEDVDNFKGRAVASYVEQGWLDYELCEEFVIEVKATPGYKVKEF